MRNYLVKYRSLLVVSFVILLPIIFFVPNYMESIIYDLYSGSSSKVVTFSKAIYPRLETEISRLPLSFFIHKIEQVKIRLLIGLVGIVCIPMLYQKLKPNDIPVSHSFINRVKIIFYTGILWVTHSWLWEIPQLSQLTYFYEPVSFYKLLKIPLPNQWLLTVLIIIFFASGVIAMINSNKKYTHFVFSLLFIYFYGLQQCFGKVDNGYSTISIALLFTPLLFNSKKPQYWLGVIQIMVLLPYFFAGLEKLTLSGVDWFTGKSLQFYLGTEVLYTSVFSLLSIVIIVFQIGFVFSIRYKKLKLAFILFALFFHLGTSMIMDVGALFSPWLLTLIFLFNDIKVPTRLRHKLNLVRNN